MGFGSKMLLVRRAKPLPCPPARSDAKVPPAKPSAHPKVDPMLQSWNNYYYMVGSAAAGLIGLLFVVVTLTAGFEATKARRGQALYMTPTVLNFAMVFSISAGLLAPGLPMWAAGTVVGLFVVLGLAGVARACWGIGCAAGKNEAPHWSDFWMYGITPGLAYGGLGVAAAGLGAGLVWAPFAMAACLLGLLLASIRNAWDLLTWIAPRKSRLAASGQQGDSQQSEGEA